MRHAPTVQTIRGSLAWTAPLRLRIAIFPKRHDEVEHKAMLSAATPYTIDRDRIFDYVKKHRLPTEAERTMRRDMRNAVDFVSDVRDIQTPSDVWPV